jgi:hypothetical protein
MQNLYGFCQQKGRFLFQERGLFTIASFRAKKNGRSVEYLRPLCMKYHSISCAKRSGWRFGNPTAYIGLVARNLLLKGSATRLTHSRFGEWERIAPHFQNGFYRKLLSKPGLVHRRSGRCVKTANNAQTRTFSSGLSPVRIPFLRHLKYT